MLLAGGLAGMILLQWRLCSRTLHGLQFSRNVPFNIEARRPFEIELVLSNPRSWLGAWWVVAHERIDARRKNRLSRNDSQTLLVNIERVLPQDRSVVSYRCQCQHRGEYVLSSPELSTRFPLSLMRGVRQLGSEEPFLVRPTVGQMRRQWQQQLDLPKVGQQRKRLSISGGDGEFFGLRDYRPGDSIRSIHWRSSAKRNELVVRQFERQEDFELSVLLDLSGSSRERRLFSNNSPERMADLTNTEIAIELMLTLVHSIFKDRQGTAIVTANDGQGASQVRISTHTQLNILSDRLARSQSSTQEEFVDAFEQAFRTINHQIPLVVVSLQSRELSNIEQMLIVKQNPSAAGNIRWIDCSQSQQWQSLFQRGFMLEQSGVSHEA